MKMGKDNSSLHIELNGQMRIWSCGRYLRRHNIDQQVTCFFSFLCARPAGYFAFISDIF